MIRNIKATFDDFTPQWHNRIAKVESHIIVLITVGNVHYRINDAHLTAVKGELLFIPKGTFREAWNADEQPHQKYAIFFNGALPDRELSLIQRGTFLQYKVGLLEPYKERFRAIYRHSLERRAYHDVIQLGLLVELLGMTCRELEAAPLPKRKADFVSRIESYIQSRYKQAIPLQTLGELIGRSPNYTLTLFKETVGMTPLDYQQHLRLTAAKDLLANSSMSVADVAEDLGYYDAAYLNKSFIKATGMTPSEFRTKAQSFGLDL